MQMIFNVFYPESPLSRICNSAANSNMQLIYRHKVHFKKRGKSEIANFAQRYRAAAIVHIELV
jgi:hypothetical protein